MKKIGPYTILEEGTTEEVEQFIKNSLEEILRYHGIELSPSAVDRLAKKRTADIYSSLSDKNINHIIALFNATKKKDAESLAKRITITKSEIVALRLKCEDLGYRHSDIYTEFYPGDIDSNDLPSIIERPVEGTIEKIGSTSLTDRQLDKFLRERKRMHIHIFEKEKEWHCFYGTFDDIFGKHGEMGEHMHYVSYLWGIDRDNIINNITERRHISIGVHIKFMSEDNK